jgi:hypothetical protein
MDSFLHDVGTYTGAHVVQKKDSKTVNSKKHDLVSVPITNAGLAIKTKKIPFCTQIVLTINAG